MAGDAPRLRVLTINLWNLNGPVRRRLGDLGDHLRDTRPDVVACQEVSPLGGRLQSELLAEAAGYPASHYDPAGRRGPREEGLAVLSTLPLTPLPAIFLPTSSRDQPRIVQRVAVDVAGTRVVVANTHLAWRRRDGAVRARQAELVRDALADLDHPRVVTGDLNDVAGSAAVRVLTADRPAGAGLVDAFAASGRRDRPTFSVCNRFARTSPWLAFRRVDHVLVDRSLTVEDAEVVLTGRDAPVVSDHFGVRATIRLARSGAPHGPGPHAA